jgi:hypothetical protein
MSEKRKAWSFGGKETTRNTRHTWDDNIKMDFREIEWGGVDWINLARDRDQWRTVVNTAMNLLVL